MAKEISSSKQNQVINVEQFKRKGYLAPLTAFSAEEEERLLNLYWRLRKLLPPEMSTQKMDWWHGQDRELWELCAHTPILDAVEAILGPDFYVWGTQFFSKDPGDGSTTPWHQDAFYWPLRPHKAVTAWLAFSDSDEKNGAMMVVPGTHLKGRLKHKKSGRNTDVLDMELETGTFRTTDAVSLNLKAGQFSLHDDNIVHGSSANNSGRLRCGLTIRYSSGEVKCDLSIWPSFKAYWVRGHDHYKHNPIGQPSNNLMTQYNPVTS